jgi:Zn-dependent M16 (insulinase) family peptidase
VSGLKSQTDVAKGGDFAAYAERLRRAQALVRRGKLRFALHVSSDAQAQKVLPLLQALAADFGGSESVSQVASGVVKARFESAPARLFLNADTQTSFTYASCRTVPFGDDRSVPLTVLAELIEPGDLHRRIRQGLARTARSRATADCRASS